MKLSISTLRNNIYQIVDQILLTGKSVTLERKGVELQIALVRKKVRSNRKKFRCLSETKTIDGLSCKPEELLGLSWESSWGSYDLS